MTAVARYVSSVRAAELVPRLGKVRQYLGLVIEASGPDVSLGEICDVYAPGRLKPVSAEVVGFREGTVLLMPHGDLQGIRPGSEIVASGRFARVPVGDHLLGRIVDAFGHPMDDRPLSAATQFRPLYAEPENPVRRHRISQIFETGVKAIDGFLTVGRGQRVGLFAGSGVGKSSLLGMIATNCRADVNIIALIGERGREVRDFIEVHLGDALARSIVIVATAEQSALLRSHAAFAATTMAEHFRDQGKSVCLMMDSVTRFAMARREIGLAVGEPATSRGYTPSVFSYLPRLMERTGPGDARGGSITAFYTVLVEGDDFNEPISDHVRATLDGHFILSRNIANRGRFPALDLSASISRLMPQIVEPAERTLVTQFTELLATYADSKDLVELGAYKAGTNPLLDRALAVVPRLEQLLKQPVGQAETRTRTLQALRALLKE